MMTKIKRLIREWLQVDRGNNLQDALDRGLKLGKGVKLISIPNFGSEPYLISIGDNTTISFDCVFVTHDAAAAVVGNLAGRNPQTGLFGQISIGKNSFIGCRSTILANVSIGDNVIIGACSLVNRDIPSNVVAAGNPCRVICTIDDFIAKHEKDFLYVNLFPFEQKKEYLVKHFSLK